MIRATITRLIDGGIYVVVPSQAADQEIGPFDHLLTSNDAANYVAGADVLLAPVSSLSDDYIVIGVIA